MDCFDSIASLRAQIRTARKADLSLGLVPTMGAFHAGHIALMRRARLENDRVLLTLFVNPTQFNSAEDLAKYPRDLDQDAATAAAEGVDYFFSPSAAEIYPPGFDTRVTVTGLSDRLEGASRPGHFHGVATVVTKLLAIAGADRAYFGEKDWQQLQIVRRLTADLNLGTRIVSEPTVREADGLAMSSRNVRLSPEHRRAAVVLSSALAESQALLETGVTDAILLGVLLKQAIGAEPLAQVDYAVVVHPETLDEIDTIENGARALVAATFGGVRLIDNCSVK